MGDPLAFAETRLFPWPWGFTSTPCRGRSWIAAAAALLLVDYWLAPEFPFPGLEDVEDCILWASQYSEALAGGDAALVIGRAYSRKLTCAGVKVISPQYAGMGHRFARMMNLVDTPFRQSPTPQL